MIIHQSISVKSGKHVTAVCVCNGLMCLDRSDFRHWRGTLSTWKVMHCYLISYNSKRTIEMITTFGPLAPRDE